MNAHPGGRSVWMVLGLCAISAGTATLTTLMIGLPSSPHPHAPESTAEVRASDSTQLIQDISKLRQTVSALAAQVAGMTGPVAGNAGNADRTPADGYALATGVEALSKRLAVVEAAVAKLGEAGATDSRTDVVASRRRRAGTTPEGLEQIIAIRTADYGLDSAQAGRMHELELKWWERDKLILAMWESGANLAALNRAIEQDEVEYQAEFESILTPQQREQRRAQVAQHGRSYVAR